MTQAAGRVQGPVVCSGLYVKASGSGGGLGYPSLLSVTLSIIMRGVISLGLNPTMRDMAKTTI